MLTPEELLELVETMQPVLDDLNTWITKDLIRRFMARMEGTDLHMTNTDTWQVQLYQEAGGHVAELQREIADFTELAEDEVRRIFEDAGIRAYAADCLVYAAAGLQVAELADNERMLRILQDTYERTNGEIFNFTRTTARQSQKRLMKALDNAHMKVVTGAQSYTAAVKEAVEELAKGQAEVVYPTGHVDTLETAVLRAVRTGTAQASGNMALQGMIDHDWDIILVSAHLGARYGDGGENPGNHFWWQGKFYSRTGSTPNLPLFEKTTGYGTGEGLSGWNCRHSFGPGDGVHNPYTAFDAEENRKAYDLSQKQRQMERAIRKTKRELLGYREAIKNCTDPVTKEALQWEYDKTADKLRKQNAAYKDFCKTNDLKPYDDRLYAAKWNREEASRAVGAAKRYKTDFTGAQNDATMKAVSGARITDQYGDAAQNHAERYYGLVRSMTTDVPKIAKVTGYSVEEIQKVKDYIFMDEHDLGDGQISRFEPSFAMAQSWQRLIDGHPVGHDFTLIQHEVMERQLVEQGYMQDEAHRITSRVYNYGRESDDYYGALKEYKNRKRDS